MRPAALPNPSWEAARMRHPFQIDPTPTHWSNRSPSKSNLDSPETSTQSLSYSVRNARLGSIRDARRAGVSRVQTGALAFEREVLPIFRPCGSHSFLAERLGDLTSSQRTAVNRRVSEELSCNGMKSTGSAS